MAPLKRKYTIPNGVLPKDESGLVHKAAQDRNPHPEPFPLTRRKGGSWRVKIVYNSDWYKILSIYTS